MLTVEIKANAHHMQKGDLNQRSKYLNTGTTAVPFATAGCQIDKYVFQHAHFHANTAYKQTNVCWEPDRLVWQQVRRLLLQAGHTEHSTAFVDH